MGIGDVSRPLCPAVIAAMHDAVEDQARAETFHGYLPECGAPFLRRTIAEYYQKQGVALAADEVFVSSGASDELGHILDLFDPGAAALIPEPAYPAYVDANVMAGRRIAHLPTGREQGFLPEPREIPGADLIYLCSPNNPTGAVILFDAAYEAFIADDLLPHSIFEIEGARKCAIEICSLSKTAGFTGTRLGYTIIPKELERHGPERYVGAKPHDEEQRRFLHSAKRRRGGLHRRRQRQIRKTLQIYKEDARVMGEALSRLGIWYTGGKNAPYIWMACPKGYGSWEFFDLLLHEIQVVGTPGEGFGACGEGYFRFSAFGDPADTAEAMRRIEKLLS